MTDYKQLCAELLLFSEEAGEICTSEGLWPVKCDPNFTLLNRARAALADPEPKGPTRRQLLQLAAEFWPEGCEPAQAVPFARAARARWGRPAPATAGEVGYLADFVRGCADDYESHGRCRLIRAAELLAQRHPQPISVNERLPGPEDWVWHCYAGVRFWQHGIYNGRQFFVGDGPESQPATHWLPAHALPVPGEVEG